MKTKRSDITDKQRKDLGACEHDNVNYKALEALNELLFKKLEYKDFKVIEHLRIEALNLRNDIVLLQKDNQDKQAEVDHYKKAIQKIGPQYAAALNKDEEQFKKLLAEERAKTNDAIRSYNNLHQIGKEVDGKILEDWTRSLPENNKFEGFKSYGSKGTPTSTLLESGKVVSKIRKKDVKK